MAVNIGSKMTFTLLTEIDTLILYGKSRY